MLKPVVGSSLVAAKRPATNFTPIPATLPGLDPVEAMQDNISVARLPGGWALRVSATGDLHSISLPLCSLLVVDSFVAANSNEVVSYMLWNNSR